MRKKILVLIFAAAVLFTGCGTDSPQKTQQETIANPYDSTKEKVADPAETVKDTKWTGTDGGYPVELIFRGENRITIITQMNNSVTENGIYRIVNGKIQVKLPERKFSANIETDGENLVITYRDGSKGEFAIDNKGNFQ